MALGEVSEPAKSVCDSVRVCEVRHPNIDAQTSTNIGKTSLSQSNEPRVELVRHVNVRDWISAKWPDGGEKFYDRAA